MSMKPIWYPLFAVCILGLAGYVFYRNWGWWRPDNDQVEKWLGLLFGCLLTAGAFAGAMGAAYGVSSFITNHSEQEWRVCWKAEMVSLRGSDGVAGSISGGIFMLSGHIGSAQFYNYYTNGNDNVFHPHKWKADSRTRIFEGDRKDGEVIEWDQHFKKDWLLWFADPDDGLAMDFYIPKGSLRQSFSLE